MNELGTTEEQERRPPAARSLRWFLVELCEDERDRVSAPRTIGFLFAIVSILLLLCSILLVPLSKTIAARCFDGFKFLLSATGPVVLLLTAGQVKSAINGAASATASVFSHSRQTVTNVPTKPSDGVKRERTPSVTPKAATTSSTPSKPPTGGRVQ